MGIFGGFFVCGSVGFLFILLLVGSAILRAAVSLTNRSLGLSPGRSRDFDDEEEDEWIGYRRTERQATAIPEPGTGKGMLIVLLLILVAVVINVVLGMVFEFDPFRGRHGDSIATLTLQVLVIGIGFAPSAWILSGLLPTSFGRACLVILFEYALAIAIVGTMAGLLYLASDL